MRQGFYDFQKIPLIARVLCLSALCFLMPTSGFAIDKAESALLIELNAKQQDGESCRLVFVGTNKIGETIDKLSFEMVLFNKQESFLRLALLDFESLPQLRTRVRQFAIPNLQCKELGQLLINGISTCLIANKHNTLCEERLNVTTKIDVELLG